MTKLVIDIKGDLVKGDLLQFDGTNLVPVKKETLLNELNLQVQELAEKTDKFMKEANEKLKEHHKVLQLLSKEK